MAQKAAATQNPRPDPRYGVFETLLVADGHPVELDAHLERLGASVRALYDSDPPAGVRSLVLREAHAGGLGRLRVTVTPDGDGGLEAFALGVAVNPDNVFPGGSLAAALATIEVDRGLGAHKWADRAALERAEAIGPAGTVPLLVTPEATVLEASRANVFAVADDALITPPADGSILPGIARACVIEIARENSLEVREETLGLDRLLAAEEVFLTGSVRGVEPVRAIDGVEVARPERVTRLLSRDLRRRWLGS